MQEHHTQYIAQQKKQAEADKKLEEEMHKSLKKQQKETATPLVVENIQKVEMDEDEEGSHVKIVRRNLDSRGAAGQDIEDAQKKVEKEHQQIGIDPDLGVFQIEMNNHDSFNLDMDKGEEEAYAE